MEVMTISKLSNMLKMIILLQSRGKMKTQELSEILEVKERQIRTYRDEMEKAGIYVESRMGPNGGYCLERDAYVPPITVTSEEYEALIFGSQYLENTEAFTYQQEMKSVVDKIKCLLKPADYPEGHLQLMVKELQEIEAQQSIQQKRLDIQASMIQRRKMEITYGSLSSGISQRKVHPYFLLAYKGSWYLVAHCDNRLQVRYFKLSRIQAVKITNEVYEMPSKEALKQYREKIGQSIGIMNDEMINVKLHIRHPMAVVVKEKKWVAGEVIRENQEDGSILYEAAMRGRPEIISWILSMGASVTVLEPQDLKTELRSIVAVMQQQLENEP